MKIKRTVERYIPSLRECFVARPGHVFSSEDYTAGELVTHAQSTLWLVGWSNLAEALNHDLDPHRAFACTLLNISYNDFDKENPLHAAARQIGKGWNFGRPGGASDPTVVLQQRTQGRDTPCEFGPAMVDDGQDKGILVPGFKGMRICLLMGVTDRCGQRMTTVIRKGSWERKIKPTCIECLRCADQLGEVYNRQWPETKPYFDLVKAFVEHGMLITEEAIERWPHWRDYYSAGEMLNPGEIVQHVSGRVRGNLIFTQAANTFFQGMLGDVAKSALRRVARECYDPSYRVPAQLYALSKSTTYAGMQSPLYGSRPVGFFHDELFIEHPEVMGHDGSHRAAEIMVDELGAHYCPQMHRASKVAPTLMRRWFKSAEPRWLHGGKKPANVNDRLVPWEPEEHIAA
jgi:hypothetical protein